MDTDFLVIGGGIAGVSVVARLSHLGRVRLVEAEAGLGYHASGRSAALFDMCLGAVPIRALNRASHAYHATANGGVLSKRVLMLVGPAEDEAVLAREAAMMRLTRVSVAEACAVMPILDPDRVACKGAHEEAWDVDTDRLIQNFAREIRANGGTVTTGARVRAIAQTDSGWRVGTGAGTASARGRWWWGRANGGIASPMPASCWSRPPRSTRCTRTTPLPTTWCWPRAWPATRRW